MARVDGVHGPEKKPTIQFINEWPELKGALDYLRRSLEINADRVVPDGVLPIIPVEQCQVERIVHFVPMLMDAYAELWELMEAAIKAQEKLQASKNDLYVPDAAEMVAGAIANPERTKR
jgi:hypothetical protein